MTETRPDTSGGEDACDDPNCVGTPGRGDASFRALAEASPDIFVRLGADGRLLYVNAAFERAVGATREQIVGRLPAELGLEPDAVARMNDAVARVFAGEPHSTVRHHYQGPDGRTHHYEARLVPEHDAGRVVAVISVSRDITEQKEAVAALRTSEERFRALVDQSPLSTLVLDREGRPVQGNAAFTRLWGVTVADIPAGYRVWHDPQLEAVGLLDAFRRAYGGELVTVGPLHYDATYLAIGRAAWVHVVMYPVRDAEGRVVQVVCVNEDVTAQRETEEALRASEERFRAVFESIPLGMAISRAADGMLSMANPALCRLVGYSAEELSRTHFSAFTHPDDIAVDEALLREIAEGTRDSYVIEKRYLRRDGSVYWVHLTVAAIRDPQGAIKFTVGITKDITERKLMEAALRRSERELASIADNAPDVITRFGPDAHITFASRAFEGLVGVPPHDARGRRLAGVGFPADLAARIEAAVAGVFDTLEPAEMEFEMTSADGVPRVFHSRMVPERDEQGAARTVLALTRDVTEARRLQERLTQAQKMEALGQLAGGVAHDFNNILAAISGYAQLLLADLPADGGLAEDASEIAKAAARGAAVTKQLLAFSRRQAIETEVLDLGEVVRDTARMLRPLLPATVALELPPAGTPPVPVRAARAQVEQILLNLAVNARDAMPQGGTLALRVGVRHAADGDVALLAVGDTGVGMSDAVRARAFEPFFTTKAQGRGTGLGLATVYGLVRQFGGDVVVDSAEGVGTTFRIMLPLARDAAAARGGTATPAPAPPRGVRVLLAEDEPQIRTLLGRALARAGHTVDVAEDGATALAMVRAHADAFDLVVSDVAMPRVGGRELALALATEAPALRVVLMSGYAELQGDEPLPPNVVGFLAKPFAVERLVEVVGEVTSRA